VVGVVAVVVLTLVLAAAARNRGHGPGDTRTVSVAADSVRTVDLQGPPGQLNIVALRTSRVTLSGPVHWTGNSAVIVTGPRLVNGVLPATGARAQPLHRAPAARGPAALRDRVGRRVT
jgi:hypothetical protein